MGDTSARVHVRLTLQVPTYEVCSAAWHGVACRIVLGERGEWCRLTEGFVYDINIIKIHQLVHRGFRFYFHCCVTCTTLICLSL